MTLRCDPKVFEKDLRGQVIIVTGANSGCGLETSRQLTKQGATVVLACRNKERGEAAAAEVGVNGTFLPLDLASLQSVHDFAAAFQGKFDRLDVLVNNAGIMMVPYGRTKDNLEMQMGCNHVAHFLLFTLLAPLLEKTAQATGSPSRFVALSSVAAAAAISMPGMAEIDFDDLNWDKKDYNPWHSYQQSKLANFLHVMEIPKRYDATKLVAYSVHPGWVDSPLTNPEGGPKNPNALAPVDGAQTQLHCVLSDVSALVNGAYYSQTGIYTDEASQKGGWPMKLPNPNATAETASRLWDESVKMCEK